MKQPRPLAVLVAAREAVRGALEQWKAGDTAQIRRCNAMVEDASAALREFQAAAQKGPIPAAEAERLVLELLRDAARMTRIVDACVSFQRGLSLRLGHSGPGYDATGAVEAARELGAGGIEA
jgi:hypothetical protein